MGRNMWGKQVKKIIRASIVLTLIEEKGEKEKGGRGR